MDYQTLLNWSFAAAGALIGWVVKGMREDALEHRKQTAELTKDIKQVEVMLVGQYVPRDEIDSKFNKLTDAIFAKLDRIETKIDNKVDKK